MNALKWTVRKMNGNPRRHVPVMLEEVVDALSPRIGDRYIDCTLGYGGHARVVLEHIGPTGRMLAIDRDPQAVAVAREWARFDPRISVSHTCFGEVGAIVNAAGLAGRIDGVLIDLGVSSPQLDTPDRGFSFLNDGPLDMRMDPSTGISAAQWLTSAPESEIGRVLRVFGEERGARRIARAIVVERERGGGIGSTRQLAAIVEKAAYRGGDRAHKHPATRTFQAIRIHINDEIGELERGLAGIPALLAPGGRLVVLSFHSLEDRVVKRFMRDYGAAPVPPRRLPVVGAHHLAGAMIPTARVRRPRAEEIAANPRARSAMLRVAERRR